jgi:predicted amidohydrolase
MRIAALQMQAKAGDVAANLARIARAASDAASQGASLLVAPELALTGYGAGDAMLDLAESAGGPQITRLKQIAADTGLTIVAGFAERADGAVWNSAARVEPSGEFSVYRKSHLYGDYEKGLFRPEKPMVAAFDHAGVKCGMLICYDVEFPENVRRLAQIGVKLVVVPTALPDGWSGQFIAEHVIRTRAFENQAFVAYVNHCGADQLFTYAGRSQIAAPDGSLLALADAQGEALLIADIDADVYAESYAANTYLRDLRL